MNVSQDVRGKEIVIQRIGSLQLSVFVFFAMCSTKAGKSGREPAGARNSYYGIPSALLPGVDLFFSTTGGEW